MNKVLRLASGNSIFQREDEINLECERVLTHSK